MEIWKKNAMKEIPGLKYLMNLFGDKKLKSELNDFQSILIISSHPLFLNAIGMKFPKCWVIGRTYFSKISGETKRGGQKKYKNLGGFIFSF